MNQKTKPLRLDVSRYRGQWLALDPDSHQVVAHDRSLKVAKSLAIQRGVHRPLLYVVPKSDAYFVG